MSKVITMGEALIDFIPNKKGQSLKNVEAFSKMPGGAPANVAVCVSRLGGQSGFIGKLGMDGFGDFLIDTLEENHVDTAGVIQSNEANTALAFVTLTEEGEREFSFYRNPSADMLLTEEEIDETLFNEGDILHFCSVDLIEAPVKYAHKRAIEISQQKKGVISFDPNVRLPLWDSEEACKQTILEFMPYADLLKLSEEELEFLTGVADEKEALKALSAYYKKEAMIVLTKGGDGVSLYYKGQDLYQSAYPVQVNDTTGAGDSFIGAFLYCVAKELDNGPIDQIKTEQLQEMLRFASGVGALTTTKEGAISALPYLEEVLNFINK